MKRIFIVGPPRSGTTLLNSCLGARRDCLTIPETHYFRYLHPQNPIKRLIPIPLRQVRANRKLFQMLARTYYSVQSSKGTKDSYFMETLDFLATQEGKKMWVEKTPFHLHRIDAISKIIHDPIFIHMERNTYNNVASLYEAWSMSEWRLPSRLSLSRSLLEASVLKWIKDRQESLKYRQFENHFVMNYDRLVKNPTMELNMLCDNLGILFDELMLLPEEASKKIIIPTEPWKENNKMAINRKVKNKLREESIELVRGEFEKLLAHDPGIRKLVVN